MGKFYGVGGFESHKFEVGRQQRLGKLAQLPFTYEFPRNPPTMNEEVKMAGWWTAFHIHARNLRHEESDTNREGTRKELESKPPIGEVISSWWGRMNNEARKECRK